MTKRLACITAAAIVVTGLLYGPGWAKARHQNRNTPVYYLSLGTSLAAGVQADPTTGQSVVTDVSYPSKLAELVGQDIPKLRHVNLGCPGETAESFVLGGICTYPRGSQLDEALQFLQAHGKFTGLITIDLGANDVLQCLDGPEPLDLCVMDALDQLADDLSMILGELREAAPGVPIVGMNYYNPLLAYWPYDPDFVRLTVGLQSQINALLDVVYTAYGAEVADVAGAFLSDDVETDSNGDGLPDSVELVYAWTWMFDYFNIHPNETGYEIIAAAFYSVLPDIRMSEPPRRRVRYRAR